MILIAETVVALDQDDFAGPGRLETRLIEPERRVFPSVGINGGVCYFLWDSTHNGNCNVTMVWGGEVVGPVARSLGEFDVLIRDSRAIPILRKVLERGGTVI